MGLIGAALGAVGSIAGGIAGRNAMNDYKASIEQQMRENQDNYDRRYNEDATQRADAQRILTMTEDSIKRRNRAAAGTAAVIGGTNESVAAEKAAGSDALANATSQIAAQAEARKDKIEEQYLNRKQRLNDQLSQIRYQKGMNIAQAIQGVSGAAGNMNIGDITLKSGKTLSL